MSIVLSLLVGPYKCGKSTFATKLREYYKEHCKEYTCNILIQNEDEPVENALEMLRNYLQFVVIEYSRRQRKERTLLLCDFNIVKEVERHEIYTLCKKHSVTFVQVVFQFTVETIFQRNYDDLESGKLTYIQMLTRNCDSTLSKKMHEWEMYNVLIRETFLIDNCVEFEKFNLFVESLFNYITAPASNFPSQLKKKHPKLGKPVVDNSVNRHEIEMQAGVLYRDKVLQKPITILRRVRQ